MSATTVKLPSLASISPRVDMHYTVEINGMTRRVELPFALGVMADLSGHREGSAEPISEREFVPVDADSFDALLATIRPRLMLQVRNALTGADDLSVELIFDRLDDFAPARVARRVSALLELHEQLPGNLAALAPVIDKQLNVILHHPSFQRLEATWRCLHRLVTEAETDDDLKILALDLSKPELAKTLRKFKGTAWDQSPIFKRVYDERYGAAGGEPFGCLLLDYYFDHDPADVDTLTQLSMIGAAAHVPVIAGASPTLFQMESWEELPRPRDVTKIFTTPEYTAWRSLRESEDARHLVLTLPRFVVRPLYERQQFAGDEYEFHEEMVGYADVLWGNAAYLLAENVLRSFRIYGWPSRVSGLQTGGAVEGLAAVAVPGRTGRQKIVTDAMVTDRREAELADVGVMALVARGESGLAEFPRAVTLVKPAQYDEADATANAALASRLPYVLGITRLAHYVKAITRDISSALGDRASAEAWFNRWIAEYVDPNPGSPATMPEAPRPLAAAEVRVEEIDSGGWTVKFFARPNF